MEHRQLLYFKTIAETGSISEAARQLHITQPPLSYQIHLLEEELGTSLFERSVKGVTLTEAGKLLYPRIVDILHLTASTVQEVKNFQKTRTLRLGMTPTSVPALMDIIKQYHIKYPDVRYEIHDGSTFELLEALEQNRIELSTIRTPANTEGLITKRISREPMMVAGTILKDMRGRGPVSLFEIQHFPWVIYRRYEALIHSAIRHAEINPYILCECDDARTALQWAEEGMALAVFPLSMKNLCRDLPVILLDNEELITDILLATRKGQVLSGAARDFWEEIRG